MPKDRPGSSAPKEPQATNHDTTAFLPERQPRGTLSEAFGLHRLLVETVEDYAIFALDAFGYI